MGIDCLADGPTACQTVQSLGPAPGSSGCSWHSGCYWIPGCRWIPACSGPQGTASGLETLPGLRTLQAFGALLGPEALPVFRVLPSSLAALALGASLQYSGHCWVPIGTPTPLKTLAPHLHQRTLHPYHCFTTTSAGGLGLQPPVPIFSDSSNGLLRKSRG